ncbi:MAG TPA: PQQ-binding-like beta-propeller repeat protein [Stellaceae bacterium]|nr:PQQ-binding-like beta-propeller repeat protein [Stellaceae bacterium]
MSRPWLAVSVAIMLAVALGGCDTVKSMFSSNSKAPLPGKRVSVLNLERSLKPDPHLETLKIQVPRPYDNNAWPDAGGFPDHAMYHLALGNRLDQVWKANAGEGANRYGRVVAEPVLEAGRIFTMDADDVVTAFDATTGSRLWRFDPQPKDEDATTYGGGVAAAGNRVYIGSGYGQVMALDAATGKVIWRVNVAAPIHSPPTVAEGRVFVVTVENELDVLSAADGSKLWTHNGLPEPAGLAGGASPAVAGDLVVVPYSSGELYALRIENGRQLWNDSLAAAQPVGALSSLADIRGAPVIDRDRVFAISHSGLMVAIDLRTGDRVWEQDIGGVHAPWVAGDFIYVLSADDELVCLTRADGRVRWTRELPQWEDEEKKKDPIFWAGPVLAGDRLIVVSSEGEAFSVSPYTGEPLGKADFPDGVFINPVVADKTLYVLTDEADLIALR